MLVELFVQETMDREKIVSPSLWKKIQQQWQDDDFFGPRGYSNELDIAPEGWGIGPGDSDAFQETDELFLAASQKFESADESSEPELDELFKVASQQIEKVNWKIDLQNQSRRKKSLIYGSRQSPQKHRRVPHGA